MHSEHHPFFFQSRKRRSSILRGSTLCSLFMVVFMLLAACGGSTPSTGSKTGGVVTVANGASGLFTDNFNPWLYTHNTGTQGFIYEALFHWNRADGKITPLLAASQQYSSDATSITFTIRQGVKWSDGQPFSADDVLFTFNLLQTSPGLDTAGIWRELKSVSEPGPTTITVNFTAPSSTVLWDLAGTYIVPKHVWQGSVDPQKNTNKNPIGTGPFVVKSFSPQMFIYKRNPGYWQPGVPYIDELHFPAYSENNGADLALSRGSIDWAGLFTPNIQSTYVNRDSSHNRYWFAPGNTVLLYLNLSKAPFNQLPVRQAISAAIDREQLVKTAEEGYDIVANPTAMLPQQQAKWLDPQYKSLQFGPPNPQKADSILETAGYKKGGDGIYASPTGERLSFNMSVITGWTDFITSTQIMSTNLKAAGIEAKINVLQQLTFIDNLERGNFDTAIYNQGGGPTPYWFYKTVLSSKDSKPIGQVTDFDQERWNNAQTDQFLQQYSLSIDPKVEQQAIYGLEKVMVENIPTVPLFYGAEWYEYSTKRFTGWPDQQHQYAAAPPWEQGSDAEAVALTIRPV